ncbi:Negative regulator of mitotic exit, partial [Ascosphaera aggregata]
MSFFFKSRKNHHNSTFNSKDKDKDRDKDKANDIAPPVVAGSTTSSPVNPISAGGPSHQQRGHTNSISNTTSSNTSSNPSVTAAGPAALGRLDSFTTNNTLQSTAPHGHQPSPSLPQLSSSHSSQASPGNNVSTSTAASPTVANNPPIGGGGGGNGGQGSSGGGALPPQPPPGIRSRSASNAASSGSSPMMIPGGFPRALGLNDSASTSLRSIEEAPSTTMAPQNAQGNGNGNGTGMNALAGGQALSLPTTMGSMMSQPPPFAEGRKRGESFSRMAPGPPPPRPANGPPVHIHPPARPPPPSGPSDASPYPWSQRRLIMPTVAGPNGTQQTIPGPFPRYGAAANSVASKEGDIYFMGGLVNGNEVKGDLWMVEGAGASSVLSAAKGDASIVGINGLLGMPCYPVTSVTEGPGPRVGHRSLLVGNAFIVFGGDTKVDLNDSLDDTLYLLNTSSRQWSRAIPPGPRPKGRYGHTLNIVGSKIYVFGGQSDDGSFFNDLICFDLNALQKASNRWQFLIDNTSDSETGAIPVDETTGKLKVPPARTNHTMVTFNDRLWLFGGTDGVHWFNDAWVYDPRTNTWTSIDYVGVTPTPREGHAAAMVGDIMYVFGGRNSALEDLDDLVAFRCTQRRWYTFQKMGPAPSPRSGHAMAVVGRWIIVIGGEPNGDEREEDELSLVYVLDTGKIRYPDSPPMHGPHGPNGVATPPGHSLHTAHQGLAGPHDIASQQQDRAGDPNVPLMQRRMMSPTGAGRAVGPSAGPGQGPNQDGQMQPFMRPGSIRENQQQQQRPPLRRGPMPPPGQAPGSRPFVGRLPPPGQRMRGPGPGPGF